MKVCKKGRGFIVNAIPVAPMQSSKHIVSFNALLHTFLIAIKFQLGLWLGSNGRPIGGRIMIFYSVSL